MGVVAFMLPCLIVSAHKKRLEIEAWAFVISPYALVSTFLVVLVFLTACGDTAVPATPSPTLSPQAQQGKRIFTTHCGSCHSTSVDTVIVGPSLAGVARRAANRAPEQDARTYLYTSIMAPDRYLVDGFTDLMPKSFAKDLTGEELDAVVAYLLTLQ